DVVQCGSLPRGPAEQPGGSLPSTDPATRTAEAAVPIPAAGPAFSLATRSHQHSLSSQSASDESGAVLDVPCSGLCDMAVSDVCPACSLVVTSSDSPIRYSSHFSQQRDNILAPCRTMTPVASCRTI